MKGITKGLVLATILLMSPLAMAQAEQAPKKPGFFRQLGNSLKDAGRQMVHLPTEKGSTSRPGRGAVVLYSPISGEGRLKDLYRQEDHQAAKLGKMEWPRVALTFKEWGASLPCWTVEATIWTSPKASSVETFQACGDAPLTIKDDIGEEAELNDNARAKATTDIMVGLYVRPGKPNTGDQRTAGPTPPREPFNVQVARDGVAEQARKVALSAAWVSGFIRAEYLAPGPKGLMVPFKDTRMWIGGFDPAGNRDK